MAYGIIWVTVTFGTAKAAQKAPILVLLSRHRTRADRDGHPRPFRGAFHQKEHGACDEASAEAPTWTSRDPARPGGPGASGESGAAEQELQWLSGGHPLCNFQADLSSPPSS